MPICNFVTLTSDNTHTKKKSKYIEVAFARDFVYYNLPFFGFRTQRMPIRLFRVPYPRDSITKIGNRQPLSQGPDDRQQVIVPHGYQSSGANAWSDGTIASDQASCYLRKLDVFISSHVMRMTSCYSTNARHIPV